MTGEKFTRAVLTPVPLDPLILLIQGGVPADFVLGLAAEVVEGRRNSAVCAGHYPPPDADS